MSRPSVAELRRAWLTSWSMVKDLDVRCSQLHDHVDQLRAPGRESERAVYVAQHRALLDELARAVGELAAAERAYMSACYAPAA